PNDGVRARMMAAELDLERVLAVPRTDVLEFARRVVGEGKRLVYLSDMYLDSGTIGDLLPHATFPDGPILVSNAIGARKAHGDAFEYVAALIGISVSRLLHVGDNARVDGLAARRAGAGTVLVDRAPLQLNRPFETHSVDIAPDIGDSVMLGLAANLCGS